MSLGEHNTNAPELVGFYKEMLLEPGWAGEISSEEMAYVKWQLRKSPSLKRRWGFRPSAKRFNEERIRKVARDGL